MSRHVFIGLLAAVGIAAVVNAHAAVFTVGGDSACQFDEIQDAIDAAATHAGPDFVNIARSATFDDISLDIEDQDLILAGGFASCGEITAEGAYTELAGDGDHSVIRIRGHGDVVLMGLTLHDGHAPRFNYGFGGGIDISDGPHLVSLTNVIVSRNDAGRGGGISVRNTISGNPNDVQLVFSDNVSVMNNRAGFAIDTTHNGIEGGGIYCSESSLRIIGGGLVTIYGNDADHDGGGIGVDECDVTLAPHGATDFNGVVLNHAGRDGGGIAIRGPSGGGTRIYTAAADRPVYIAANVADREGGGIKVNGWAKLEAWDLIVEDNRSADEGAAVSVAGGYFETSTRFVMRSGRDGAPAGAVPCNPQLRCNRISGNVAMDENDVQAQAAAVRVYAAGGATFDSAYAFLHGTLVEGNVGLNLMRVRQGTGTANLDLDGVVISGNAMANELILNPDPATLSIRASTIAGNTIGGADVIRSDDLAIEVRRSIVWQPGKRAFNVGGLELGQIEYVLASDLAGVPPTIFNQIADPDFADAASGDFRLQPTSPAVDVSPAGTDATDGPDWEADGAARVVDIDGVANEFGAQDLGAYELQPLDVIFANGFDG